MRLRGQAFIYDLICLKKTVGVQNMAPQALFSPSRLLVITQLPDRIKDSRTEVTVGSRVLESRLKFQDLCLRFDPSLFPSLPDC
jgi:hypothetical protein